jgi:hypothetical protein
MSDPVQPHLSEKEYQDAQKRVRKIKKFYKDLASWAGTSVILVGINIFLSGNISWAKFPVVIWGIVVLAQVFEVIRLQRLDKEWEDKQVRRFTGNKTMAPPATPAPPPALPQEQLEDYTAELLNQQEREIADLSEYRKLKRPWEDKDLV